VNSTTNSLSVTLRDLSTTRVTARDSPEDLPHESIVKFPERKQELYDQEVHNLPIDLHDMDVNTSFWVAFPTDPAHKHMHEMDWDPAFRDSVIPQNLPPPGRFGHGDEISYSVGNLHARPEQRERDQSPHANLVFCDQGCARSCGAKKLRLFRKAGFAMIIKIQDAVLSMVAMRSPTVFVPGYAILA